LTIFARQAMDIVDGGGKVVQYFAYPKTGALKLLAVLRTDKPAGGRLRCPEAYPSMSSECEPFHLFERELAEQFGVSGPRGTPG
jgi:hypothetical protein